MSPSAGALPSGLRKIRTADGHRASRGCCEPQRIVEVVLDGNPFAREPHRRRDQFRQRELAGAEAFERKAEAGDGAGHADAEPGIPGLGRIGLLVGPEEHVGRRRRGAVSR